MLNEILSRLGLQNSSGGRSGGTDDRGANSWAESIGIELKGLIAQSILSELKAREEKYLLSILSKSQFLIESLVVTPLDHDTSQKFESFLDVHAQIDPSFKVDFFKSLLESQYRSDRGAMVTVGVDFQPTVQFLSQSLEQPSEDEMYQVSLRGRRLRFKVQVTLAGPVPRGTRQAESPRPASSDGTPVSSDPNSLSEVFTITIWDADGRHELDVASPCMIGRELPPSSELGAMNFVTLNGKYVSRRHLVVLAVMEDTYFFLHEAASLSCLMPDGSVLARSAVQSVPRQALLSLVFGASEAGERPHFGADRAEQFPMVEMRRKGVEAPLSTQATPRPRAVR